LITWASQQPTWASGFLDEVWWSRFALPRMHAWQSENDPVHLVEQSWKKADPDPKALACYGVLWQRGIAAEPIRKEMSLRFVTGRPVSEITTQFLDWCCAQLQAQGKTSWLLVWDNASWHYSKQVRTWIREHNRLVKQENKGVRILPLFLPKQSPWLNPINPNGSMPSAISLNLMACLLPPSLLNASVPTLAVRMSRISPFPKRLRDSALSTIK